MGAAHLGFLDNSSDSLRASSEAKSCTCAFDSSFVDNVNILDSCLESLLRSPSVLNKDRNCKYWKLCA